MKHATEEPKSHLYLIQRLSVRFSVRLSVPIQGGKVLSTMMGCT